MSKNKSKKVSRKRRSLMTKKNITFIECPVAGAMVVKTNKGNRLHVFDCIGFMAKDANNNYFDIEGLVFHQEKGWYEAKAAVPKYYGKNVYSACHDYAVDIAIRDNLFLGIALLGSERPAKSALVLSHSEVVQRMQNRSFIA